MRRSGRAAFTALVLATAWAAALPSAGQAGQVGQGGGMRIAVLVDTGAGTHNEIPQVRQGLAALLAAIPDDHEIALITTGRNVATRVPPTLDRKKLHNSINGLMPGDGPTPLMDALVEVDDRFMQKAGNRTPVFIIITGDGSENSKLVDGESFNQWLAKIRKRGVVAHAIVLKKGNGIAEAVAAAVVRATGGHFETVGTGPQLAARLQALGEQIAAAPANQRK